MKLPETVIMAIRSLIQTIEADPTLADTSYQLLKTALLSSFGKTKWQMAYALLDHPDLGDRRPSVMMAEMLSLRYETTAPDSLFLALFLRRSDSDQLYANLSASDNAICLAIIYASKLANFSHLCGVKDRHRRCAACGFFSHCCSTATLPRCRRHEVVAQPQCRIQVG